MKISELMVILAKALQKHGDIEVSKGCGENTIPITNAVFVKGKQQPIRL